MNKKQKTELEDLRRRWNWNSAEAINDRNAFVLNSARKDYEKVLGESGTGIGLARWQSDCIDVCGSGNFLHTDIELAPEVSLVEDYKNPSHIPGDFLKRLYAGTGALALVGVITLSVGPIGSSTAYAYNAPMAVSGAEMDVQSLSVSSSASSLTVSRDSFSVADAPVSRGASVPSGHYITPSGTGNLGLVGNAMKYVGAPWDCTAVVEQALRDMGHSVGDIGPTAFGSYGTVFYSPADVQPGDIMMRGGHVSIYLGNGIAIHGGYNGRVVVTDGNISNPATYHSFVRVG